MAFCLDYSKGEEWKAVRSRACRAEGATSGGGGVGEAWEEDGA